MKIIVWNEAKWDRKPPHVQEMARAQYPDGINAAIVEGLQPLLPEATVETAVLDDPEHGLGEARLADTDVLVWWGHNYHRDVEDAVSDRVVKRVREGMGFLALHSAHMSKPFTGLLGTSGSLCWRNVGEREILWFIDPGHPMLTGFDEPCIVFDKEEMYGEPFAVPQPDELLGISHFAGGEVFRSICAWRRERGRIVYMRPGDERYPTFHDPRMHRLIANAVRYVQAPAAGPATVTGNSSEPLVPLE